MRVLVDEPFTVNDPLCPRCAISHKTRRYSAKFAARAADPILRQLPACGQPSALTCPAPDLGQGVKGGLIGIGQRVQVPLGGAETAVTKPLPHHLEVSAAGQQP